MKKHLLAAAIALAALGGSAWLYTQFDFKASKGAVAQEDRLVVKSAEEILLMGLQGHRAVSARIDTGAKYSSLDAGLAKTLGVGKPVGYIKIQNAHGTSKRPLVEITFVLKHRQIRSRFSIADRKGLEHPVLIGRESLKGFLVDPSEP